MVPFLLNTFAERSHFINVFEYYYNKNINKEICFLTIAIDKQIDTTSSISIYPDIQRSSDKLHECTSRYERHVQTLQYLRKLGYEFVVNCLDDGWITKVDWMRFDDAFSYLNNNDADRIDLCGVQSGYEIEPIDSVVSLIKPSSNVMWYVSNQCAIWKIDSLLNLYEAIGKVFDVDVEKKGSEVARQLKFKFLTFNEVVIDCPNVFNRIIGLNDYGEKLLMSYCENNNLDYKSELKKYK
jgi:hypothetical protein